MAETNIIKPTNDSKDFNQIILNHLETFFKPGSVIELRIPKSKYGSISGYFDDFNLLADELVKFDGKVPGIYITLNPVNPDLLFRAKNKLRFGREAQPTTSDQDVIEINWLLLDFDPVRPSDISSSNEEHEKALTKAQEVREWLTGQGWPTPIFSDSGNGGHLLYPVKLPNDQESRKLIDKCLKALDLLFSDESVKIDTKVGNPGRIWKLYGTMSCKGDNLPERPWRYSKIIEIPENLIPVLREILENLVTILPEKPRSEFKNDGINIEQWLEENNLKISKVKPWNDGILYELEVCPWNPEHKRTAYIVQFSNGGIAAKCFHNSCCEQSWFTLRDKLEPGWRKNQLEKDNDNLDFNPLEFFRKPNPNDKDEITWTIPGLIPRGYLTWLVGYSKTGKSWLSLKIACDVSLGGPVLDGVSDLEHPLRVLYVLADTSKTQPMSRLRKTRWNYNPDNIQFLYQNELAKANHDIDLATENGRAILEKFIQSSNAPLVFLDSLSSLTSSDLIKEENAKPIALYLNQLAEKYQIALVVLYHSRKPKKEQEGLSMSQHDISGSGVLMRFAGSSIGVELKVNEKTGEKKHLVHYLAGWVKEFPQFSFTLEDDFDDYDQEFTIMSIDKNPDGKNYKELVWDRIQAQFFDVEFTRAELTEQIPVEVSEVHLKRILSELVKKGKLKMSGTTRNAHYSLVNDIHRLVSLPHEWEKNDTNKVQIPTVERKKLVSSLVSYP
ncbi:MAG: AAA family ATPase [Atribacterota bacterium]|jgi:hypothetical protein|nr:AAA family ATPase [Atribacterota bacterium]HHT09371.1 AAA family ATPase [Candidatus Atribacteria bacterium]